jgi:hypothetical protein
MSGWLPEHDNALRRHLENGMSLRDVAAALNAEFHLGKSKNATLGRAWRLGAKSIHPRGKQNATKPKSPRKPRTTPAQRPDIAARKAASGPKLVPASFVPRPDPRPGHVPLLDLVPDGCKWPSGDGPFLFCNEPRWPDSPYCGDHHGLAYRAPEPRRQRN